MCNICGTELKIARIKAQAAGVKIPKGMSTIRDDFHNLTTWFAVWHDGSQQWIKFTCCAYDAKRSYIEYLTERVWRSRPRRHDVALWRSSPGHGVEV